MIGKTLSRYKIVSKLGEGGMGEVYLAEDTELGREVALKVLPLVAEESPERLERFRREARAVASLNHPNIVTLFNVEEAEGRRLLVMEKVEGKSLDRVIQPGGMPLSEVFSYAIPMADALAAAHEKGITHRDLKPANVMITDAGGVKVLDFGLAKLAEDVLDQIPAPDAATAAPTQSAALTGEGTVMGTAPYMSPEQLSGKEVDSRTDIFSFGILLYEMVTGKRPFQGDSGIELASSILKDTPSTVTEIRDDLPRHLGRIIQHCLEKDPERRFQSAKDIRNELEGLKSEVDSGAVGPAQSGPTSTISGADSTISSQLPSAGRRSWGVWAAAAAAVAILVLGFFWLQGRTPSASEVSTGPAESEGPLTVAVLPFANLGADEELDYLRVAVPDEIATALSRSPELAIRPFSMTAGIELAGIDLGATGRDLGVDNLVMGQYIQEGDQLSLTLEAIDVAGTTVLWRGSVVVGSHELVSLRQAVAEKVAQGLIPILDPTTETVSSGTLPSNNEAYDLYLRSLAINRDPEANEQAIALVERATELDPDYAPAWAQLADRYHLRGVYTSGLEEDYDRAVEAGKKALELDPDLVEAHVSLVIVEAERGQLVSAYESANRLIARRPKEGLAYFARGYLLRYAGAVDQSVRDCDMALSLDPNNRRFRSCALSNSLAGRYERADQFLELSPGTEYVADNHAVNVIRQGRFEEVKGTFRGTDTSTVVAVEVLEAEEPLPRERLQELVDLILSVPDAELPYWTGSLVAFAGEHEAALTMIRGGIERGCCAYPFMDTDPLLAGLRADPELADAWAEARAAGKACHERFLAETGAG